VRPDSASDSERWCSPCSLIRSSNGGRSVCVCPPGTEACEERKRRLCALPLLSVLVATAPKNNLTEQLHHALQQ
jgi:hypothetical protein